MHGLCCRMPFYDLVYAGERSLDRLPCSQSHSKASIARLIVSAGEHQATEAGETHESLAPCTERLTQPRHFREPSRDQRDTRVRAVTHTIGNAGADGEDVFHCPANFNANDI